MRRESEEVSNLFKLSFGDHFTVDAENEEQYTALLSIHAEDRSGMQLVCLRGHQDIEVIDMSNGDEVYFDITILPDDSMEMSALEGEDREELEQKFHMFLLLLTADRITANEQPRRLTDGTWTMHVNDVEIVCQKTIDLLYGEVGEYTAHLFIGSEKRDADDIVKVYLVFLEETENDPVHYEPIDEVTREMLYEKLMKSLGLANELEGPDDESEPNEFVC